MTQPDGLFPESAFNFDSIAELAAKTQEDWETELYGNATGGLNNFQSGLFAGLPTGMPFGLSILTVLLRQFLGDGTAIFPGVSEALDGIRDWSEEARNQFLALLTSLLNGLGNIGGTPTTGSVGDAMGSLAAAQAAIAAQVNKLTQQNLADSTGADLAIDDLDRTGADLGTDWDVLIVNDFGASGSVRTDGKQAVYVPGGFGTTRVVARFQGDNHTAASDTTETSIVLGTPIGSNAGPLAAIDIHGRMSADKLTSVRARLAIQGTLGRALQVHARVAGVETLIGQKNLPAQPAVSTIMKLICGTTLSSRQFVVKLGSEEHVFDEVGTTSQIGASYRERGMGWRSDGGWFGQAQPGAVAHFTSIDVGAPTPDPGSGGSDPDVFDGGTPSAAGSTVYDGGTPSTPGGTVYDGGTP